MTTLFSSPPLFLGDMTAVLAPDPFWSPTTQRYFLQDDGIPTKSPMHHDSARECSPVASTLSSTPPSPNFTPSRPDQLPYTPSSLSLDDELILPAYDSGLGAHPAPPTEPDLDSNASVSSVPAVWTSGAPAADDSSVEEEPSRHVDYLSHDWREEDIWASWRYVTARKNDYSNGVRLENASWRTWAKAKHNLGTISPETLNWYVDGNSPPS